ncbi:short-chain dehydrogenase [Pseudoalteromonas phenolica]|uniref:Short-chain dehydrogenase n=1 Tax=Pseudoalteromonas phenolica TaxID=161398 RepID=A0A4Q7ISM7_9GAMM|nr:SDR family oxidoreductase [Pseudoalteromonas phenolica]RZQ55080.1 short-chain dehydrogenase [Pseudoalteromonas phenolica]
MKTVFITGANRGIGLALSKVFLKDNWQVIATCRDIKCADELNQLKADYNLLHVYELDITDYQQMAVLSSTLHDLKIDVLLNNAGLYGPKGYGFGNCDVDAWRDVFEANVIAPTKLAEAFVSQVLNSELKIIAALSSRVGSHTENTKGGGYIYRSSKAALNSVVKSLSNDLLPQGIKTVALHPGWVQTEMGGPNALISAQESAIGLKQVIESLSEEQSGGFYSYKGEQIPW